MHACSRPTPDDPAFAPEEASPESLGAAHGDGRRARSTRSSCDLPDDEALAPIAGPRRRRCASCCASSRPSARSAGAIRHHGDLHLGQVLWADGDWLVDRLRGRAGAAAPRAAAQALAAARRRRDAALVHLRRRASPASQDAERRGAGPRALPRRLPRRGRRPRGILPPRETTERLLADLRAREGGLRAALRARPPPRLGSVPVAGHRAPARARQMP